MQKTCDQRLPSLSVVNFTCGEEHAEDVGPAPAQPVYVELYLW